MATGDGTINSELSGVEALPGVPASDSVEGSHTRAKADARARARLDWMWDILLIGILLVGAYFRLVGLNWDGTQHLHPDERFLTMVETSLQPVKSLGDYFNTATSTLNPNNQGYGFFVYGTLPIFIVRYLGEWLHQTGYDQIHQVGRQVSAIFDIGTVLIVYLIAVRLFRSRRLGLLAAAFSALSVLPIQLSHYFTVESATNFFGFLAFYFATWILPNGHPLPEQSAILPARPVPPAPKARGMDWLDDLLLGVTNHLFDGVNKYWGSVIPYILFWAALGMAVASKINAAALAALLPGAVFIRWMTLSQEERVRWTGVYLRNLMIAGVVSLIAFRIFQPYAFSGPGFFGMTPNPKWVQSIQDQRAQAAGDVDFPPALQWARRPFILFAFQNLTIWGLGLPLGILAWASFLFMGWRMLRGEWRRYALLWGWTTLYFLWQASSWNPTMRYLMLIYPSLAIIAAWGVFALWERGEEIRRKFNLARVGSVLVGVSVLALTFAWAYAFTRIYTRPVTRVAASEWIYQNVPGPINLRIEGNASTINQPLAFRSGYQLSGIDGPLALAFRPDHAEKVYEVTFEHLGSMDPGTKALIVSLAESRDGADPLATTQITDTFNPDGDPRGKNFTASFADPVTLDPAKTYYLVLAVTGPDQRLDLAGTISLTGFNDTTTYHQALPEPVEALRKGQSYQVSFSAVQTGTLRAVVLDHVVDWEGHADAKTLELTVLDAATNSILGRAEAKSAFAAQKDPRGEPVSFALAEPVALRVDHPYTINLQMVDGPGVLAVYGSKQANESDWDDALPLSMDGYNPYDYNLGVYRSDLNFQMYWDDNQDKLDRFISTLNQADYIFISSNRQWGTTVRVPERYPLTTEYYRDLIGCPADKEITWCYSVAEPGMFQGKLGFTLAEVFQSEPNLGSLTFNTQFAEEAFSVYDHPKVLIFKKTADYNPDAVQTMLGAVDLSTAVHVTPRKASSFPANLMLPPNRLAQQQAGGTWADLFHPDALYNRYPFLAAALWYLVIALLGMVVMPFTRLALHGLPDRGYPFGRLVGMLALAYLVWLPGSYGIAFTPLTITAAFVVLMITNAVLAYTQRKTLAVELRERWKYYLLIEGLFLVFFLLFLFVRFGNPDLWHPWKGGEKPMDFSYFNAVLKSTTFPPYDPWFAGGYINYYYYGFVIVGVPVKWLGIVPSIAYNLILPTLFALLAMGAFSLGWNLVRGVRRYEVMGKGSTRNADGSSFPHYASTYYTLPFLAGLGAALAITVLGNWGTVRMVWHGVQRLADMQVPFEQAGLLTHISWTIQGLGKLLAGAKLPYGPSDWYWIPSRALPGWTITEFPAFTFLYADLHAHMIALPLTVLALAWALSLLLGKWGWKGWSHLGISFLLGGLVIGALKPTNTWDWPTYLAIACAAIVYTALRYGQICCFQIPGVRDIRVKRAIIAVFGVALLFGLSTLMYQPFSQWYGQGYNKIVPWDGDRSPFWSYMTHWGVFLFLIASWMAWETIDWMATTPVSALNRLRPYRLWIQGGAVALLAAVAALLVMKVEIAWLALPMAAWAGVLLLRPRLPDAKRAVLFLIGTGLFLTLFVEVARLDGDLDRMNTVFKFYLQAWTLFSISAAASLFWLAPAVQKVWHSRWELAWEGAVMVAIAGAALFPVMAGSDKISDRMAANAPPTLDGMTYMDYSTQVEGDNKTLDLSEDYRAIQWMQRNISGSPVIVEANLPEYHWGTRFTVYTGLPGVVGWNWHQRQQRAVTPDTWVTQRVDAVGAFYNSFNRSAAESFLRKYGVKYIIVGQLERAVYNAQGIQKFSDWNGDLWQEVYQDGSTAIYAVK